MEPGFTKEELDKITLSNKEIEHYSKPDELKRLLLKRLLLERNFYKKVMEQQIEKISILDKAIYITLRNYIDICSFKRRQFVIKSSRTYEYLI